MTAEGGGGEKPVGQMFLLCQISHVVCFLWLIYSCQFPWTTFTFYSPVTCANVHTSKTSGMAVKLFITKYCDLKDLSILVSICF